MCESCKERLKSLHNNYIFPGMIVTGMVFLISLIFSLNVNAFAVLGIALLTIFVKDKLLNEA